MKSTFPLRLAPAVSLLFAAVLAVFYFLAMKSDFDPVLGHFAYGSVPFLVFSVALAAAVLVSLLTALLFVRRASFTDVPAESPLSFFGAVLAAFMSVACAVSLFADIRSGLAANRLAVPTAILLPTVAVSMALLLIPSQKSSKVRQIFACLAVLAMNLLLFSRYFDFRSPLNSPVRNVVTVAECALLLFLLSEARFAFGASHPAEDRARVPFAVFSCMAASSIGLGYSVGASLTFLFAPVLDDPNPSILALTLDLAIAVLALARLIALPRVLGSYTAPDKA